MSKTPIVTAVVGSHSTNPRDIALARALRQLNHAIVLIGKAYQLGGSDMIALLLSTAAALPDGKDSRELVAELMEQWAKILRSDQEVHMTAQGNA